MHTEFRRYRDLLKRIDLDATQDQLSSAATQLRDAIERYHIDLSAQSEQTGENIQLPQDDLRILHTCAEMPDPSVRHEAMFFLCDYGPITWEDIEGWATDPDAEAREAACEAIIYGMNAICNLCESDMERCGSLFDLVFPNEKRFWEVETDITCWILFHLDRECIESAWRGVGIVLDLDRPRFSEPLTVGFLETALAGPNARLTYDDPLVQAWLEGRSPQRKLALLAVAEWFGLATPGQKMIAKKLSRDSDKTIREAAKQVIKWNATVKKQDFGVS